MRTLAVTCALILASLGSGELLADSFQSPNVGAADSLALLHRSVSNRTAIPQASRKSAAAPAGHTFWEELTSGNSNPVAKQRGQSESDLQGVSCSAVGCWSNSSNENEDCVYTTSDTVNGGCIPPGSLRATPLAPFQVMCGQTWAFDGGSGPVADTDWYHTETGRYEDSLTWCITAEFDFDYELWHVACGGGFRVRSGSGLACDTVYVSTRGNSTYPFDFKIFPSASNPTMTCELGPWNYHITLLRHCESTCPPGSVDEGEGCSLDSTNDNFNGGCLYSPEAYSTITPGQPVCGQIATLDWNRDSDWYRSSVPLEAGDYVSWSVSSNFPHVMGIFDQRHGCITREIGGNYGEDCSPSYFRWKVDTGGVYSFVVAAQQTNVQYPCETGPWTYTASLEICKFDCLSGGMQEGEVCETSFWDNYNGGCNASSGFPVQPIDLAERICGETWTAFDDFDSVWFRDTDWYVYNATAGEVISWTVRAEFVAQIGIVDLSNGCNYAQLIPADVGWNPCLPVSVTYATPDSGDVILFVAPSLAFLPMPLLTCANGPWRYEAIVETAPCVCDCAADPNCDGNTNISDVSLAVNVAFRNNPAIADPSGQCPWARTDVNCSGDTNILDVSKLVDVAFRNANLATVFCNPCP